MKQLLALALLTLLGCGDASRGTLRVMANGEAAAVQGYPVTIDGDTIALEDDFTIAFEHVYVGLSELRLETAEGDSANVVVEPVVIDLARGPAQMWEVEVPAQRWDRVSYRTHVPGHDDRIIGDVSFNAVHAMLVAQYATYVLGTATQSGETYTFAFGFPAVQQSRCENGDGTEGIVVRTGAVTEAEVTIHLDHIFFDSLASNTPAMRFEPFAAASFSNDVVNAFLTQPITDVRDRNGDPIMSGGNVVVYDPGPFALSPMTVEQFVLAAGRTMGHWNGEGHCEYGPVEE